MKHCKINPVVNQIEIHPFLQQRDIVSACKAHKIVIEAYSPIVKARKLDDPVVVEVARSLGKTPAQILIAWGVQKGYASLPKTVTPARLGQNADVFFVIPDDEMCKLDSLDCGLTTGWDPTTYASSISF
jgi:diketogulonate reductase-like aldo/keto reductase